MELVRDFTTNNFHIPIKIIGTHDNPLFCAYSIAEILDITNIRMTIQNFDETEKVSQIFETKRGPQNVSFLTEKGLYKVLFRSRSQIAEKFQDWICEVIKEIRLNGQYKLQQQLKEKEEELKIKEEEFKSKEKELQNKENELKVELDDKEKELKNKEEELNNFINESEEIKKIMAIPSIYIWNNDFTKLVTDLKIGRSENFYSRIKKYQTQTPAHGRLESNIPVYCRNLEEFEKAIFCILQQFNTKKEGFLMNAGEAKMIIMSIVNIYNLTMLEDSTERMNKFKRISQFIDSVINNSIDISLNQRTISTQSDFENDIYFFPSENEIVKSIEKFIQERCLVREDVESSSTDIEGGFRIWAGKAEKEIFHTVQKYFRLKFLPDRLKIQDKNQVINGFKGIKVNEIEYIKSDIDSDEQNFIFHSCIFSLSGKVTTKLLINEYKKWRTELKQTCTEEDIKKLIDYINDYLISQKYVISSNIWLGSDNTGRGYYGIYLKGYEVNYKKSSTGRPVEKRDLKTDAIIATYETRAKAAASENVNPCNISRWIINKVIIKDYYFCDKK